MSKQCSEKQFVCMFLLVHKMFWYLGILNFLIVYEYMSSTFLYQEGLDIYILTTKNMKM